MLCLTSWISTECFGSSKFCFCAWWWRERRPSRWSKEHAGQMSCGRVFRDGFKSTGSIRLRHVRLVTSHIQLNAKRQRDVPTHVGAVAAVSAGDVHTCAVRSDGQLVCSGANFYGQCDVPTNLGAVLAVSAGYGHTCAVRSDGRLVCFGLNDFGQCDVPTNLGAVLAVSAGSRHTCAVRSDGQLVCFGWNYSGQCDVPTDLGAVLAVSAGYGHTCAVRSDGRLVCLGWNNEFRTMRCADGFGSSSGSLSREPAHLCSEIRWSVGLLWR